MSGARYKTCSKCGASKGARAFRGDSEVCRACEGTLSPKTLSIYRSRDRDPNARYPGTGRRGGKTAPMPGLLATREALGLSVARLAGMAGVSAGTISELERGKSSACEVVAERILRAVVSERRRQREAEMERWERLQKAGVGFLPVSGKREE